MKIALDCFGNCYEMLDCKKCSIKVLCRSASRDGPRLKEAEKNVLVKTLIASNKEIANKYEVLLIRPKKTISKLFPDWVIEKETGKLKKGEVEGEIAVRKVHRDERSMFRVEDGALFTLSSIPTVPKIFLYKLGVDDRGFSICQGLHETSNQLAYWYHPQHQAGKVLAEKVNLVKLRIFDRMSRKLLTGEEIVAKAKKKAADTPNGNGDSLEGLEEIDLEGLEEVPEGGTTSKQEKPEVTKEKPEVKKEKPATKKKAAGVKAKEKPETKPKAKTEKESGKKAGVSGSKNGKVRGRPKGPDIKKSLLFVSIKALASKVEKKAIYTNFLDAEGRKIARISGFGKIHLFGNLEYLQNRFRAFTIESARGKSLVFLVPEKQTEKFCKLLEKAKLGA